jgi:hypothetical protein
MEIFEAASRGDIQEAGRILGAQPEALNLEDEDGNRPLAAAANYGQRDMVEFMLQMGAEVDHANGFDNIEAQNNHFAQVGGYLWGSFVPNGLADALHTHSPPSPSLRKTGMWRWSEHSYAEERASTYGTSWEPPHCTMPSTQTEEKSLKCCCKPARTRTTTHPPVAVPMGVAPG